jgi:hypothetical protein
MGQGFYLYLGTKAPTFSLISCPNMPAQSYIQKNYDPNGTNVL